jgi:hypothetical protein
MGDDADDQSGIFAISIVDRPAIKSDFIALKEQSKPVQFAEVSKDKRLLVGAALIPDKPIIRFDDEGDEYFIYFKSETIRKAAEKYLTLGFQNQTTLQHQTALQGLSVVESWIVEDPTKDKSSIYGIDVPAGTWMITMKVYNDDVWETYVKKGEVKGFSIEGLFQDKEEAQLNEVTKILQSDINEDEALAQIKNILK